MSWLDTYHLPFSWSHSRALLFEECPRKYYWRYYAPYGGNSPEEKLERSLIYFLGRLTNVPQAAGSVIHELARDALRSAQGGHIWAPGVYEASAVSLLSRGLRTSQKAVARPVARLGRGTVVFDEHYYRRPFGSEQERAALDRAAFYGRQLPAHPLFRDAQEHAADILAVDHLDRFDLGGVPVHAVPDVVQRLPGDALRIVDWKTGGNVAGRMAAYRRQLGVYALYARGKWGVDALRIGCCLAQLHDGATIPVPFDDGHLDLAREGIAASIAAMQSNLRDPARNVAHRDNWPPLAPPDAPLEHIPHPCLGCAYRQPCYGDRVFSW